MDELRVEEDFQSGWVILRLAGELDLRGARVLRASAEAALCRRRAWRLLLNLKKVSFLDSSGLGAMLAMYRSLALRGGALVLVAPPPHVRAVLELGGLGRLVPIMASEARATTLVPEQRPRGWPEPEPWGRSGSLGGA